MHPARAAQYTTDDIEQTLVLHERHEPGEEFGVRDREVVSIVAPSWGARKGEFPSLRSHLGVTDCLEQ